MKTQTKRATAGGIAVGAVAAVIATVWAFGATAPTAVPEPTQTAVVVPADFAQFREDVRDTIATEAAAEAARVQAEQAAADAAAAEAEAARVEAERVAAEQQAQADQAAQEQQSQESSDQGGSEPAAPVAAGCPAGSAEQAGGTCYWEYCFTLTVPDAAHPECDSAFRP